MEQEIYIDEEKRIVLIVDSSELDPNGNPLFVEYTFEEWDALNE
jgi:hypothetical protein